MCMFEYTQITISKSSRWELEQWEGWEVKKAGSLSNKQACWLWIGLLPSSRISSQKMEGPSPSSSPASVHLAPYPDSQTNKFSTHNRIEPRSNIYSISLSSISLDWKGEGGKSSLLVCCCLMGLKMQLHCSGCEESLQASVNEQREEAQRDGSCWGAKIEGCSQRRKSC